MAASRNSRSADLPDRVAAFFAPRLADGRRVAVALSGGRDSVALLQALVDCRARLPLELSALHVHHGLSANADAWADFCAGLCRRLDVPLQVTRVAVAEAAGEGLEAAARRARYAAFAAAGDAVDWLALAHHRDDQAETLLLNLLRGAGVDGLAAMPEERLLAPGARLRLVRPLLAVARQEIDDWLAGRGLSWVEDESNADSRLRRNFLRNEVLPRVAGVFPQPAAALARSAALLAESAVLADELAAADAALVADGKTLRLSDFNALPPARRANLLRRQLRAHGGRMPDARYLAEILRQLAAPGATPRLPVDGGELRVHRGRLHFRQAPPPAPAPLRWQGEASLPWAGGVLRFATGVGIGLACRQLQAAPVSVRARLGGERLQAHPRRPRRPLKKLLQEGGVPVWQRECLPLVYCGDELVWAAGIGVAAGFAAAPDEAGVLPMWEPAAPG
ncbi:MAG TPA: tRNA lysidine(34) synthetase TilS [Azospira sp.]|nr:tRNA lysidine(34) synthetase TilS [Azospira sp.]